VTSLVLAGTYAGWKGSLPEAVAEQRLENALVDSTAAPGAFVHKYLPDMFGDAATSEMRHDLAAIMADFHPAGFRQMATALARADTRELLPTINVPTLLVWGDADKRSPLRVAHAMRDAILGARLKVIAGAGHLSNLEQPSDFTTIVRNFCEESESTD
jgi:pimeloyl-ACP methyl ester carboxylesterase